MRSQEKKNLIVQNYSDPEVMIDALDDVDILELICMYENSSKVVKNTGPETLNINSDHLDTRVFKKILSIIGNRISHFEISAGLFFRVEFPHIIHNDDTYAFPQAYKGITIPLELYGEGTGYPSLVVFDQYYLDGPSKFFNGGPEVSELNYNKAVYDYDSVINKSPVRFDRNFYEKTLSHLRYSWLEGLSVSRTLEWKPGNILIFDSTRLHCASDFRKLGYTGKLGLSIFTKIP